MPGSQDHDPATGAGSRLEHAILEYGGFNFDGLLSIQDSSPRIVATTLRGSYDELAAQFQALVDEYVATKYPIRFSG